MAPRRLQPVPDTPPRAVLYLRQSVSRDDSISLELQETAGRDYCRRQGYQVVAVEADPGISGRTWKRPAVQRVMSMVDEGAADVVVLWKWSRLSRSRRDWAIAVDRVDVAGGRIESATEQVDVSTATGRLARGVLAEFAAFESDRIGEVWKEVHGSRLAEGYAPNGKPRFGYVWDPVQKLHIPDPVTGPILAELYDRYLGGASVYTLVRWLNAERITTTAGNQWADRSLRRVMDAGFGAGIIMWRGEAHAGRHERLVSDEVWQAYRDARQLRRVVPARVKRSRYTLSGLVRCARCGGTMVANPRSEARDASYRCKTAKERGPEACAGGYVSMAAVEERVLAWLEAAAADVDGAAIAAHRVATRKISAESDKLRWEREVEKLDVKMADAVEQKGDGVLPREAFMIVMRRYAEQRAIAVERLEEAGRAAREPTGDVQKTAAQLLERWPKVPVETRRETLGKLLRHVEVLTGTRGGVKGVQGGRSNAVITVVPVWT